MAQSMLDFGQVMQFAMGMQNLEVAQERNRLTAAHQQTQESQFDESMEMRQQEHTLQQQQLRKTQSDSAFTSLEKLKLDPSLALNRERQMDITQAQVAALEHGMGVKIRLPDRDEMRGGYESVDKFVKLIQDPNATSEDKYAATVNLTASNPAFGIKLIEDMKKAGDVSFQMEELHDKLSRNKAQLAALNVKTGHMKMQENFFTEHSGAVGRVLMLPTDKNFAEDYRKIVSFSGDNVQQAREVFRQQHPLLETEFEKRLQQERPAVEAVVQQLEQGIDARWTAVREYQAKEGAAPQEMVDELAAMEGAYKARRAELNFIENPYDKDNYKELQKMHQDLRIRQSSAGKQLGAIANEQTQLMSNKYDDKKAMDTNIAKAQQDYFELDTPKQTTQAAAKLARQYGVKVEDVLKDPNKSLVTVNQKQESAESSGVGTHYSKQFAEIDTAGIQSFGKLAKLNRMNNLLDQVQTGKLQPTKQRVQEIANGLGFDVDPSLPASQALQSMTNEMALSLRAPGTGSMSDKDLEVLQTLPPNLSKTPEGNTFIVETYMALAKREQDVAKLARDYRGKKGHFDGGFQDVLAAWVEKHPMFDKKDLPKGVGSGKKAADAAPAEAPSAIGTFETDKEARYQAWKNRQGK